MSGSQIMVVWIVALVMIASIIRARYGYTHKRRRDGSRAVEGQDGQATRALLEEVKQLRERVQVLERITVEKENSLERQIEELRNS